MYMCNAMQGKVGKTQNRDSDPLVVVVRSNQIFGVLDSKLRTE